jgi:hypothetical protein
MMESAVDISTSPDPLIAAVATYREAAKRFNELPDIDDDAEAATTVHIAYDRLSGWTGPVSREGALSALLLIRDREMIEEDAGHAMLAAAIRYVENHS